MIISALVVLFIIQLISIYLIVLLNGKISNFKDLERRQDQLVREMDDAISVYLLEMREENDRLIKELQQTHVVSQHVSAVKGNTPFIDNVQPPQSETVTNIEKRQPVLEVAPMESRTFVPKTAAASAYSRQKIQPPFIEQSPEVAIERTQEQQIIEYYQSGMTVEEIAKKLQKGKTEIELLIKFHA